MCILVAGWWGIVECKIDFWFLFHTGQGVLCTIYYLLNRSSTSGNSSKLEVSSIDLTVTGMAAGRSLMWSQSTLENQFSFFMSFMS